MTFEYASQFNRAPFSATGRLVVRRALRHGDKMYQAGEELPASELPARTVAILWDQGWIDTLPAPKVINRGK